MVKRMMSGWSLDKHVPIGVIVALIIQTIVGATYVSSYMTETDARIARLEEIVSKRDHDGDRLTRLEVTVKSLQETILSRLDRIERKLP